MTVVFSVLLGLVVGSFLNVVIHRVPRKESLVLPSSRCPACKEAISVKDNIPVVSYLLLKGRCRYCGERISIRYPVVEGLTGLLFGAAAYKFGLSLELLWALTLIAALIALAGIDLEHRLLPNILTLPAALAGLILSALKDPAAWWIYIAAAVAVGGALFALAVARPGGMGMGDVKLGAMLGAFLGWYAALAVFIGALSGALAGVILISSGKATRKSPLPFGVFLALGGLVVLFEGPDLWGWYMHLVRGG